MQEFTKREVLAVAKHWPEEDAAALVKRCTRPFALRRRATPAEKMLAAYRVISAPGWWQQHGIAPPKTTSIIRRVRYAVEHLN